ncbi:hypothetical protein [Streptomyces sp. NPDC058202]
MEWRLPDPMLAKAVEDLPTGPVAYEAKWDGFRAISNGIDCSSGLN